MGTKFNKKKNCFEAYFSKRHPITRQSVSMRRTGLKSQAEAKRMELELAVKIDRKFHEAVVPRWDESVDSYIKSCIDMDFSATTINSMKANLNAATSKWNGCLIDSISTDEIREVIKVDYADKSISQQRNVLKAIKGVFRYALERGDIQRNPVPHLKFREGDKIKKVLTKEQVKTLLESAQKLGWKWYYHYAVALYTGLRNGELIALNWNKIDFERRQILVDCSWDKFNGYKETKSGDDRIVEIAPNLMKILKEIKLKQGASEHVLPRFKEWLRGDQARELRRFCEGIGLPAIRFHDLRATWATIMLGNGVAPIKVMVMGGWKDLKTMQYYIRKAGVDIKGITDDLELHDLEIGSCKVLNFGERS